MKIVKNRNKVEYTKLKSLIIINPENINNKVKEINYVDIGSTKEGTITDIKKIIGAENFPSRAKRKTIINDIIYSTVRPNLNGYAIIKKDNITVSTGFAVVRPLCVSDTSFIYNLLKSEKIKNKIMTFCEGGNYPAFKPNKINLLDVININVEERKKISILLSEKEQHIENIKSLISKLEKRNEYYADKLLSGELRVRQNEKGEIEFYENTEWKEVKLNGKLIKIPVDFNNILISDIAHIINGFAFKNEDMISIGKYPIIKMSNFKNGKVEIIKNNTYTDSYKEKVLLIKNDLLIGLSGSVGSCAIFDLDNDCFLNQRNLIVRSEKNQDFLNLFLSKIINKMIKLESKGGIIPNLSHKDIENYNFYQNINELGIVATSYKNMFLEKQKLENLLEKETKEFEWLSEKLLSGEYIIED